jgi:hypothetical protein
VLCSEGDAEEEVDGTAEVIKNWYLYSGGKKPRDFTRWTQDQKSENRKQNSGLYSLTSCIFIISRENLCNLGVIKW